VHALFLPGRTQAQYLISRDLRFESWVALKLHIFAMTLARQAMSASILDSNLRTLHIRCGRDLQKL